MASIEENVALVKSEICAYESRYERTAGSVLLLAASKQQSVEKIQQAVHAGQINFGENYLQEALPKIAACREQNIIWHFIGLIQRNKTKKIAEHFAWVHSVASPQIAERLNHYRPEHLSPLNICLQVNISAEAHKTGVPPAEVMALAKFCQSLPRLTLRGLMAIPPLKYSFAEQRAELNKLRLIYDKLKAESAQIDTLSMGMSADMEAAIAEGSTLVRIGTAIFGART